MKCEYVRTCQAQDLQVGDSFYWEPKTRYLAGLVTVSNNYTTPVDPAGLKFTFPHDASFQAKHESRGRIALNLPRDQEITVLRVVKDESDLSSLFQEEPAPLEDDTLEIEAWDGPSGFTGIPLAPKRRMKVRRA
jgi:hypothetical protein